MRLTSPARNLVLLCGALTAVIALAAREHWDRIDGFTESAMHWAAPAAGNGHANASSETAIPPKYSLEAFQYFEGTFGQVAAGYLVRLRLYW